MTLTANANDRAPTRGAACGWLAALVAAWFALVLLLAANDSFVTPPGQLPLPILVAVVLPVAAFVVAMLTSPRLRALALAIDPVLLTEAQAWRIAGGMFLVLYAFGHLPGLFAYPAGLGDAAIGIAAPFVALGLRRDPAFLAGRRFRAFHLLGLLDFAVAVGTGLAARDSASGLMEQATIAPMGELPLALVPAFAVPAWIILHLIALMQSAAARR